MPSQTATIWAGATGAALAVAGAVGVYWVHPRLIWATAPPVAATEQIPSVAAPIMPVPPVASAAKEPPPATPAAPAADKPSFDVVSVEPTGETVVAGRAAPNAKVELRDAGKAVGEATANAEGQFVIIPPTLAPGEHSLALAAGAGPSEQMSNAITVAVAEPVPPKVAAASSAPPSPPPSTATTLALPSASGPAGRVAVQSVEASPGGRLVAKGVADPNALVRLYLGDAFVGDAKTGADGRWSLTIERGMTPGAYDVRADEINPADAKVAARADAPFNYPATAPGAPIASPPAQKASPADLVVDSIQTHHVDPGNTLWGISQKFYGDGSRYEIIFAANSGQIRNPNLIYPGQTFVVPQPAAKPEPKP